MEPSSPQRSQDGPGTVVVTGASSGIGRAVALRLCAAGFRVLAGVRSERDGGALREAAGPRLTPLRVDVTSADQIAAAASAAEATVGDAGLAGLVNNAGVALSGPIELVSLDDLRWQFEVNVFGQVAITQALLPMIRRARGRIVNIGSIGDRITIPFGGPLTASKHALASINDALRMELHPWGIHVALVEPGSIVTRAVDKLEADAEAALSRLSPEGRALYGDAYRTMVSRSAAHERRGSRPEVVAEAVLHALTARTPRTRYLVGATARPLALMARVLPDRVLDQVRFAVTGAPREFGLRAAAPRWRPEQPPQRPTPGRKIDP
ncbi:SDR family oxidoreductase [Sorangium sp. So ce1078]|uniref:SDR family oxidoreductase n=1 Tax=Sorangium sp. So ce1078 TaxID=3133329 RepID=UPI003F6003C6